MGFHPLSGRELNGTGDCGGLSELEPEGPVHWKVHGKDCETQIMEGASVYLFQLEEKEKILIPVMPRGVSEGVECGARGAPGVGGRRGPSRLGEQIAAAGQPGLLAW